MPVVLRVLLICSALWTASYMLRGIRKSQMSIQESIFWIVFSIVVLALAIFPQIIMGMVYLLGIDSPVNLVFLVFIFGLYMKLFAFSQKISALENKIKKMTYELAVRETVAQEEKPQALEAEPAINEADERE